MLKVYRVGIQLDLKHNQIRLLKVVLGTPNERDLILKTGHKRNGSEVFVRKNLPLVNRVKRREAERKLKLSPDAGEKGLKIVNVRVMRLRQQVMPEPLCV